MNYLLVKNGIVINRIVGNLDVSYDSELQCIPEDYRVDIGWKFNEKHQVFTDPSWTDETWENYVVVIKSEVQNKLDYYTNLRNNHLDKFEESTKMDIKNYQEELIVLNEKINLNNWAVYLHIPAEPLTVRPNLDNEV